MSNDGKGKDKGQPGTLSFLFHLSEETFNLNRLKTEVRGNRTKRCQGKGGPQSQFLMNQNPQFTKFFVFILLGIVRYGLSVEWLKVKPMLGLVPLGRRVDCLLLSSPTLVLS